MLGNNLIYLTLFYSSVSLNGGSGSADDIEN